MKDVLLSRWRHLQPGIRGKLYWSFTLMALSLVAITLTTGLGLHATRERAAEFGVLNKRVSLILDIDREIVDLQRGVQIFSYTGHESAIRATQRRIKGVRERLTLAMTLLDGPDEKGLLERMEQHLGTYEATFESAVVERTLRLELVRDTIPELEARVDTVEQNLRDAPYLEGSSVDALMKAHILVRTNFYRYLSDPDYALLTSAASAVEVATQSATLLGPGHERLALAIAAYQETFARVVRATRGYLYLVGVVMAGEAHELGYVTQRLRTATLEQAPLILETIDNEASRTLTQAIAAAAVASVAGSLLMGFIARSIASALVAITGTLRRLANGEDVAEIPGSNRKDEIGVLAQAANSFREQNKQTAALLHRERELGQQIEASRLELERSNDELEQFVYTVSHDLKSPIVTCTGFIGMMKDLAKRGREAEALAKLDVLERANSRMSQLTTDLLELSRVGRVELDTELLSLDTAVDEVLHRLGPQLESTKATVKAHRPLGEIAANESRILQLLENLIGNALKYGGGHQKVPGIEIGTQTKDDGSLSFYVKDNGPGIAPEYQERVFVLFERLQRDKPGTGVGLAIVAKIMKFHGGRVYIESKGQGDGCTFWLKFPHAQRQDEAA